MVGSQESAAWPCMWGGQAPGRRAHGCWLQQEPGQPCKSCFLHCMCPGTQGGGTGLGPAPTSVSPHRCQPSSSWRGRAALPGHRQEETLWTRDGDTQQCSIAGVGTGSSVHVHMCAYLRVCAQPSRQRFGRESPPPC